MMQSHLFGASAMQANALQFEKTKLLYAGLPTAIIINALLALILASVQSAAITPNRLFGWLAMIGTILLVRTALAVAWRRSGSNAANCDPSWIRHFRISVITTGMVLGIGAVLLFPSENVTYQVSLSFVLAGMSAGAITLLAVDRLSMLGFLVPTLVPLIARFGVEGGALSPAMGAMVALFLFFTALNATRIGRSLYENLRLRIKAEEHAFYDTLTQLPNRRLLNDRLGQTMAASKRSGRYGALIFLDLDNFKMLNDTHGHNAGDLLLIEVARRITCCMREADTVARFGGDEFVVMIGELDVDKAASIAKAGIVAEKIRIALDKPYVLKGQQDSGAQTVEHQCTSSIGVVLFINHEISAEEILKRADMAMYQAKEGGRNQIHFYE